MTNYLAGIKLREPPPASSYLSSLPITRYLGTIDRLPFSKPVTFFVGENGTGKSTLLEAIAIAMGFNAEGGSRDFMFSSKDTHSELYQYLTMIKTFLPKDGFFLRAESFYNTASYLDATSNMRLYGGVSFHKQSHGESFLSLVTNRFRGNGLYLLDEPESALSPQSVMSLLVAIDRLVARNSQLIIATHSPILMTYPDAEIFSFGEGGIQSVSYAETEHFRITKQFMDRPEQMINRLLDQK